MIKTTKLTGVALLLAISISSCSLAPKQQTPTLAQHQQNWVGSSDKLASSDQFTAVTWSEFFTEPQLQQLINLALKNNFDLRITALNVEQIQAQYSISKGNFSPKVGASLQATRQSGVAGTNYQVGLGVMDYELDFFGKMQSLKNKALAQYLASTYNVKTAKLSLVAQVATSYLTWLATNQLLNISQATVQTRQQALELEQLRYDNGISSQIQLQQAKAELAGVQADIAQLQQQLQTDKNNLELLVGTALPTNLTTTTLSQQQLAVIPAAMPAQVISQRPDVMAAEQELRAANANIGAARAAFFPSITLTANAGKISSDFSELFSGTSVWNFIPKLNLPIFTGGTNTANLKISKVQQKIALINYEKILQTAFYETSNALTGIDSWQQRLQASTTQQDASAKALELISQSYKQGVVSHLEVLNAQRDNYRAQQAKLQTELGQLINRISLYKALGGWQEVGAVKGKG